MSKVRVGVRVVNGCLKQSISYKVSKLPMLLDLGYFGLWLGLGSSPELRLVSRSYLRFRISVKIRVTTRFMKYRLGLGLKSENRSRDKLFRIRVKVRDYVSD